MNMRRLLLLLTLTVNICTWDTVIADEADVMPETKTQHGITFLSGGIGKDQSDTIKAAASDYTLVLTCATSPFGEYLADVKVSIKDKGGSPVLETVTDGPFLLAKLAPGKYQISAESNGETVSKSFTISSKHAAKLNLYWPEDNVQSSVHDPS